MVNNWHEIKWFLLRVFFPTSPCWTLRRTWASSFAFKLEINCTLWQHQREGKSLKTFRQQIYLRCCSHRETSVCFSRLSNLQTFSSSSTNCQSFAAADAFKRQCCTRWFFFTDAGKLNYVVVKIVFVTLYWCLCFCVSKEQYFLLSLVKWFIQ